MTRISRTCLFLAGTLLALSFASSSADAQTASRGWVSGKGTDAPGCGPATAPCRTPQYAHDHIVTYGGEIDILDPAGYGSITITKAISIVNDGVGTAGMLAGAGGNAITINAGFSDVIQLRGLTIDGTGVAYNGIVFNSGGSLTVANCVVLNFVDAVSQGTGNGILIAPTNSSMTFLIANTIVSHNGFAGINYQPPSGTHSANGVIDHLVATENMNGIFVDPLNTSGGFSAITISNSISSNNRATGAFLNNGGSTLTVSIDNSSFSGNATYGIDAENRARVLLSRSVMTANDIGVLNDTSPNSIFSYQNNQTGGNVADFSGPPLGALTPQ
jgi:Right handed beta helix region